MPFNHSKYPNFTGTDSKSKSEVENEIEKCVVSVKILSIERDEWNKSVGRRKLNRKEENRINEVKKR